MASIVYVSSSTTDVITEIASTSEVIISNLQGPQGATGPQGPQGTPGGIASVVAPITNVGTETDAIIGINSSSANTANYVVQRDANKEFVAGAVTIDTTLTPTSAPGKLYWNGGGTVNLGLEGGNVSVALGENLVSYVTNAEATTLAVGEVVYVFGAAGDRPSVKRAINTSDATSSKTLGIVAESIAPNAIGFVTTRGIINKINTSAFTPGQTLYLGATAGTFTSTKPVAPNHLVTLGVVLKANAGNGEIYVSVQNGFELEELHDVLITSAANGNFLVYDSATSLWKNQAISATAPITYNAGTRTIAANAATTSASGVVQLSDSTSTTSSTLASTPTAVKAAYDLATTANATANAAIPATQKAAANGVATLDASGLVPTNQLPALAITNTFVVNSQAAMLALTAETGDVAIRTDLNKSFILTATPASTLANWQELLTPPDAVTSVDGRVGAVSLTDLYAAKTHAATHASAGSDPVTLAQSQITNLTTDLAAKAPLASPTFNTLVTVNNPGKISVVGSNLDAVKSTGNSTTGYNGFALVNSTTASTYVLGTAGASESTFNVDGLAGAMRLRINSSGLFGINATPSNAQLRIGNSTAANAGLVVIGAASQSGDLTQWQSSSGTVLTNITSNGAIVIGRSGGAALGSAGLTVQGAPVFTHYNTNNTAINVTAGVFLRGNTTGNVMYISQLGDASNGVAALTFLNTSSAEVFRIGQTGNTINTLSNGTTVGSIIKGAASQSADLLQVQDSTGKVLDAIGADGLQLSQAQLIQYGAEGSVLQNIPTRVHPAETLLKQAVWWIDSAHSGSSGQAIKNLGWGGSALDATAGSTTSADSNDPRYLDWDGRNYVYTTGVAGNFLSVPFSTAVNQIQGNLDIRVQVAMDDWTPATVSQLMSNYFGRFYLNTSGALSWQWVRPGSVFTTSTSSVAVPATDGTPLWVRFTFAPSPTWVVTFYTSTDGTNWTQLGTPVTGGVDGTPDLNPSAGYQIGELAVGNQPSAAKFYRAQILNGIDGVPVLDVDTSVIASGSATSFTALTGQTVTINRSTSGRKTTVVTHPVWLFGTDDFMEVNNRWLERTTANYLYLPGVAGNYASAPDSAALDITGDLDLRVKVALDDWTPATGTQFISKWTGAANLSYVFIINPSGSLTLAWTTGGSSATQTNITSTSTVGFTDGATKWVRVTLDADNGASGNTVTFLTSDDGTTWTQLGAAVTTAGVTSIYSGTSTLAIGAYNDGSNPVRGKFFRAQVLNGIGGTVAFDANFETGITTNLPTTFIESSANAATVTINYSGTGYRSAGVIASTYVFPGNPNTFKLSSYSMLDFGATESFTAFAVVRQWNTPTNFGRYIDKIDGSFNTGYYVSTNGTTQQARDGVASNGSFTVVNGLTKTAGDLSAMGMIVNRSSQLLSDFLNGTINASSSVSSIGSLSNSFTMTIGKAAAGGSAYQDFEFVSAAIFRRALTAAEVATLSSYFNGRVA